MLVRKWFEREARRNNDLYLLMPKDAFENVMDQVPEEQNRLLERMMKLGLVVSFAEDDKTGRWVVRYTRGGRKFLQLVQSVSSPDPSRRLARLMALDLLANDKGVFGSFADE